MAMKPETLAKRIESNLPDFTVTSQDLKAPTRDFVVAYYTRIMQEFGADFGPHYASDITHTIKVYAIVAKVFSKFGFPLSLDDFVNPVPKRTLQLIAIMDNFHNYADRQAREVKKLEEKRTEKMTIFNNLMKTKNDLLAQENQRAVNQATRLEQCHQLHKNTEELKLSKVAAIEKKRELLEATKIINGKLASAEKSVQMLASSVADVNEELSQLDKKIVTVSLEELQKKVADLETDVRLLEDEMKLQNTGLQQKDERIRSLKAELITIQDSNQALDQAWDLLCEEKELFANLQAVLKETELVDAAFKQMQQRLQAKKKEFAELQKLNNQAKLDFEQKIQMLEGDLKKLKQEYEDVKMSQQNKDDELANMYDKISALEQQKEEEIEAIKRGYNEYEEAYDRYKLLVKKYAEAVLKNIRNITKNCE